MRGPPKRSYPNQNIRAYSQHTFHRRTEILREGILEATNLINDALEEVCAHPLSGFLIAAPA